MTKSSLLSPSSRPDTASEGRSSEPRYSGRTLNESVGNSGNASAPLLRAKRASWIIVSYNTREVTLDCLRSLQHQAPLSEQEVIVVDNDSQDGTVEAIRREFPWVNLIASRENLGFARGTNLGIRESTGDLIILLNPDTVAHPRALETMMSFMESHPEVGIAGGKLFSAEGKVQWSQRSFPNVVNHLATTLYLHLLFPKAGWTGELDKNPRNYDQVRRPDWVSGAYLAIRREVYERIGGLDERYFMYYEDVDWCYQCRKAGWEVAFVPESMVTHYGGLSSNQNIGTYYPRMVKSELQFNRKQYTPVKRWALDAVLCLSILQRAFVSSLVYVMKRRKDPRSWGLVESRWRGFLAVFEG